ncbi:Uma2 family endonuclease, partial [Streptomyces sp. SID5914]|nr:Uma2 family endonuclease [Streptomyces sp. SID5914]
MCVRACPGHRAYRCTARLHSRRGQPGRSATMTVLDDRI